MGALLGGVDGEGKGVAGIEQMENKTLTGEDGYQVYQQGNNGVEIPGTMTESKDAVNGSRHHTDHRPRRAVVCRKSTERKLREIQFAMGNCRGAGHSNGGYSRACRQ